MLPEAVQIVRGQQVFHTVNSCADTASELSKCNSTNIWRFDGVVVRASDS